MAYVVGLLVVLLGLWVSIALHELGHMVPAKRFGVRVSRYMVGFGPTLWSRTRGETEYGLKAIPLGGYVRLVGMLPPADVVGAAPRRRASRMAELVDAARDASAEEIRPGEDHRAFYRLSTPKKVVVMLGGPFMNLVIAFVLMAIVLLGIGVHTATTTVGQTLDCIVPVDEVRECTEDDPLTPSAAAGLEVGDVLLSYGGRPVETWDDFTTAVREVDGTQVPLVVERDGTEVTLEVTPVVTERPVWGDDGRPVLDEAGDVVTEPVRYIGLSPTEVRGPAVPGTVASVVGTMVTQTGEIVLTLPQRVWDIGVALVTGEQRGADSVVSIVGVGRFAGEVAAAEVPGITVADRVSDMLTLLALLNVALFVFNLIPLVPLDGGHVAGALWEGAKRQVYRLRGLPRPAPADVARTMPLAYGVFVVLGVLGIFLIYADLVRPVTI